MTGTNSLHCSSCDPDRGLLMRRARARYVYPTYVTIPHFGTVMTCAFSAFESHKTPIDKHELYVQTFKHNTYGCTIIIFYKT